jgi:hypothetical protein
MQRAVTDRYLPPDHAAYVAAEPPTGRLIVIAPTRAACETPSQLGLRIPTTRSSTTEISDLAAGKGLGSRRHRTGKSFNCLIAETILRTGALQTVVNREREATPETPSWNVTVVRPDRASLVED